MITNFTGVEQQSKEGLGKYSAGLHSLVSEELGSIVVQPPLHTETGHWIAAGPTRACVCVSGGGCTVPYYNKKIYSKCKKRNLDAGILGFFLVFPSFFHGFP